MAAYVGSLLVSVYYTVKKKCVNISTFGTLKWLFMSFAPYIVV